jgi:hypothetical protein
MDIIKIEPCSDVKVEKMSQLSEYPSFDIKQEDLVSVVKNEDVVRYAYVSQCSSIVN